MRKRGQLLGQPFVMIFALIVGALILAWGTYEVYKLVKFAGNIQVADHVSLLTKSVERYYYFEPGSSTTFQISFPEEFSYACFVNHDIPFICRVKNAPIPCLKPTFYNHAFVAARSNDNIFVFSKGNILSYNIPHLSPPILENPLCVMNNRPVVLTTMQNFVEVSNV